MVNKLIVNSILIKKSNPEQENLQSLLDCAERLNNELDMDEVNMYLMEKDVAYDAYTQLYRILVYLRDKLGLPQPEGEF